MMAAVHTIGPALASEARKFSYFIIRALPLLLLFLIPGLNLLAPLLWLIFSSWMLALEYLDYPMSANGLLFNDIRQQLGQQRMTTLAFGGGILLLTVIPVINFFIMPIAVAGATALYVDKIATKD
jgi:CysZ protein